MRLRIIAGELGGRFIQTPRGRGTRPTAERVREAWMSAMEPDLPGSSIVDLFAGSGALGIEALSRGARHVHFVESDRTALATLRDNLSSLGVTDAATIVPTDVFRWLRGEPGHWDLAVADPPYAGGLGARLIEEFRTRPFAECLWLEHGVSREAIEAGASWTRKYGDSRVSRFCVGDEQAKED